MSDAGLVLADLLKHLRLLVLKRSNLANLGIHPVHGHLVDLLTLLAIESFAVEPVCKLALSLLQIVHGVVKIGPYHADTHHACQW